MFQELVKYLKRVVPAQRMSQPTNVRRMIHICILLERCQFKLCLPYSERQVL